MIHSSSEINDVRLIAESYSAAEEMLKIGTWQLNLTTGHIQYSQNLFRIFGYEPGAIVPSLEVFFKLVHPDDLATVQSQTTKFFETKNPQPGNYRIVRPDGSVRHVRGTGKLVQSATGENIMVGTTQDITDEENLRKQLNDRQYLLESVTDNHVDIITALDNESRIIVWNARAESHYNRKRKDVVGKNYFDVFPEQRGNKKSEWFDHVMKTAEPVHVQQGNFTNDKGFYEMHVLPLRNDEGNAVGILSIVRDTTSEVILRQQLLQRNALVESLIDNLPLMVIAFDKNLRYTAWNRNTEVFMGLAKNDAIGKSVFDLFPNFKVTETYQFLLRAMNGETIHRPQVKYQEKDGYYESFLVPVRSVDGEVEGVISIGHDITERIAHADDLKTSYNELKRVNRELASFAYVASHDLKEPLRKIQVFAGRILEKEAGKLTDSGRDYFSRMQTAAGRMDHLIEDLLTFSRTNTLDQTFEPADLSKLLEQAQSDLAVSVAETSARIDSTPLPTLRVIPFQIRQLFQNLIANSIKFRKSGLSPRIDIKHEIVNGSEESFPGAESTRRYLKILYSDNGIGFDQKHADRIFELFQRLHGKTDYPGTGIGLAICKKIIENHSGYITAQGTVGVGAAFTLYLPME